jgi:transketolase
VEVPSLSTATATVDIDLLREKARRIRADALWMAHLSNTAHVGGSLSAADIVATLYFGILRVRPEEPKWPDRDRFIMSKGHTCSAWYSALAERGFIPREELLTYRKLHSRLQGHPDMAKMPGVEMTAGSLGHGLPAGLGMALAARLDGKDYRTYVMLGDGEIQEGLIWESALAAPNFKLDNLVAILDNNGMQSGGAVADIAPLGDIGAKWRAFGWDVIELDGHDIPALVAAFQSVPRQAGVPTFILANTVKGKGVSFMENDNLWHGKAPDREQLEQALGEIRMKGVSFP